MRIIALLSIISISACFSQTLTPVQLADLQLKGYNERNIDLFLSAYSDSVKVFDFPDKFIYQGKETMRNSYAGFFKMAENLNCAIQKRIVLGNTVIDHERVLVNKGQPEIEAVAIYKVAYGKIQEVYFMRE